MVEITGNETTPPQRYRVGEHPDLPPPILVSGPLAWLRRNFFSSIRDAVLTVLSLAMLYLIVPGLIDWAFVTANFDFGLSTTRLFTLTVVDGATGSASPPQALATSQFDLALSGEVVPGNKPGAIVAEVQLLNLPAGRQVGMTLSDTRFEIRNGQLLLRPGVAIDPTIEPTVALAIAANAASRGDCVKPGACWTMVINRVGQFMYGFYPSEQRWRVDLAFIIFVVTAAGLLTEGVPGKRYWAFFMFVVFPLVAFEFLVGGTLLPLVATSKWGGLMLTLVISIVGIVFSIPLGVLLALARRSLMPVNHLLSVLFIEFVRGVPLITILFMANVMLPLFLPRGITVDILLRVLIGVTLFTAAYIAEAVRGGLQAVPRGQYEGAMAMGLGYWQMMRLIILPQALRISIPSLVNTSIGLFMDTTLVAIVGLYDFLNIVKASTKDQNWLGLSMEGYVFAAAVYWVFCFGMSRYSRYLERKLAQGRRY